MKNIDVIVPPDSDDEDAKVDLLCRRKLFLKKARKVASARRRKGRMLLEALDRPGCSQLQVRIPQSPSCLNSPVSNSPKLLDTSTKDAFCTGLTST